MPLPDFQLCLADLYEVYADRGLHLYMLLCDTNVA
jgi:hypothetical protein